MFRYIVCSDKVNLPTIRNSCAKSLYKKLDGAYDIKIGSTTADIKSTILYQIPVEISDRYNLPKDTRDTVNEMDVRISFATYSDKLRVEVIQLAPEEYTMGFKTFNSSTFDNTQVGIQKVIKWVKSVIEKQYNGYEVLF